MKLKFGLHLQKKYFWFPEIIKKQGEGVPDLVHVMRTLATESIPNLPPGGELASKWVHISVRVGFGLNHFLNARPLLKVGGQGGEEGHTTKGDDPFSSFYYSVVLGEKDELKNGVGYESLQKLNVKP